MSLTRINYIETPFFNYLLGGWVDKEAFKVKGLVREGLYLRNIKSWCVVFFGYGVGQRGGLGSDGHPPIVGGQVLSLGEK